MAGDYPTDDRPTPSVFTFNCQQCGSPIKVHAPGQSLTFACLACNAIVQEDSKGQRVLTQTSQTNYYRPIFELGTKVEFLGDKWQILGFMVRSDLEGEFFWREYLLFNPYLGYRFLTEADGHWNFLHTTKVLPTVSGQNRRWMGSTFKNFYRGTAKVHYVLGEFYWRVKTGDSVQVQDFIAPPDILSAEIDDNEIVWSAGKYVSPESIQSHFKLIGPMPTPIGVAPNEPAKFLALRNGMLYHWLGFTVFIFLLQLGVGSGAKKELIQSTLQRPLKADETLRTETFTIDKDNANLEISIAAPLINNWIEVDGMIVPEDNQTQAFGFQRELSRYTYADAEDNIVQDSTDLFFPHLPKGRYHIEFTISNDQKLGSTYGNTQIDPTTGLPIVMSDKWMPGTDQLLVKAVQNPPLATPLCFALIMLSIFPIIALLRDLSFENSRWTQSNQKGHT